MSVRPRAIMKSGALLSVFLAILITAHTSPLAGAQVTFTIDPARSSITLSGEVPVPLLGSYPFKPQGPGGLTTVYSGTIVADLLPPMIGFPGGSLISANTNGTWQPAPGDGAGKAPADYGGEVTPPFTTGYAAVRNLRIDLAGPATPLAGGSFDVGLLAVTFLTNTLPLGSIDFRVSSLLPGTSTNGTVPLVGSATNGPGTAYLTNAAGLLTLFLPVNTTNLASFGGDSATLVMQGQMVATAPESAWPIRVDIRLHADQVTLTWPALPGQVFEVQTTADLSAPWVVATGTITFNTNTATWTGAATGPNRFYRVVATSGGG